MAKHIAILQGHPDRARTHLGHALGEAYAGSAAAAGHEVTTIDVAGLEFPLLRTAEEWKQGPLPPALVPAQEAIGWANHLVVIYPLWTGTAPALFKGFLEQVLRPDFAFRPRPNGGGPGPGLKGKSARVVVTMGMPALFYRWFYGGWGVRNLNRNALGFCGIGPIRTTYIGGVDAPRFAAAKWIDRMHRFGAAAT